MDLHEIQSTTKTILDAHPFFSSGGFSWFIEDGQAKNRQPAMNALKAKGIYGVIQRTQNSQVISQNRKHVLQEAWLPISVSEHPEVNRTVTGFNKTMEECLVETTKALLSNTQITQVGTYSLREEAVRYLGYDDGAYHWSIHFNVRISTPIS